MQSLCSCPQSAHLAPERGLAEYLAPRTAPARCRGACAFLLASSRGSVLRAEWGVSREWLQQAGRHGSARGPASDARTRSPPPIWEPLAARSAPDRPVQRSSARRNADYLSAAERSGLVSPWPGDPRRALQGSCDLGWRGVSGSDFLPSKRPSSFEGAGRAAGEVGSRGDLSCLGW